VALSFNVITLHLLFVDINFSRVFLLHHFPNSLLVHCAWQEWSLWLLLVSFFQLRFATVTDRLNLTLSSILRNSFRSVKNNIKVILIGGKREA